MLLYLIILYFVLKAITGGSSDSYRKYDEEEWLRWNYENR